MSASQGKRKINMPKQQCNYCRELGHRIHKMDEYGVYVLDAAGQRVVVCPKILAKPVERFPALSGGELSKSEIRKIAAGNLAKEEKVRRHKEWLERQAFKEANKKAVAAEEDCHSTRTLRSRDEYEEMCQDERAFQEDTRRDRDLQAKWAREDKEREERRATMTEKEKQQEEEEWEEMIETGYQKEQDAMDYWRQTGRWLR